MCDVAIAGLDYQDMPPFRQRFTACLHTYTCGVTWVGKTQASRTEFRPPTIVWGGFSGNRASPFLSDPERGRISMRKFPVGTSQRALPSGNFPLRHFRVLNRLSALPLQ